MSDLELYDNSGKKLYIPFFRFAQAMRKFPDVDANTGCAVHKDTV